MDRSSGERSFDAGEDVGVKFRDDGTVAGIAHVVA
jgi:hypothetical protein